MRASVRSSDFRQPEGSLSQVPEQTSSSAAFGFRSVGQELFRRICAHLRWVRLVRGSPRSRGVFHARFRLIRGFGGVERLTCILPPKQLILSHFYETPVPTARELA